MFFSSNTTVILKITALIVVTLLFSVITIFLPMMSAENIIQNLIYHVVITSGFVWAVLTITKKTCDIDDKILPMLTVEVDSNHTARIIEFNQPFVDLLSPIHGIPKYNIPLCKYLGNNNTKTESELKLELRRINCYDNDSIEKDTKTDILYNTTSGEDQYIGLTFVEFSSKSPMHILSKNNTAVVQKRLLVIDSTDTLLQVKKAEENNIKKRKLLSVLSNELRAPIATSVMILESGEHKSRAMTDSTLNLLNHSMNTLELIESLVEDDDTVQSAKKSTRKLNSKMLTKNSISKQINELYVAKKLLFMEAGINFTQIEGKLPSDMSVEKYRYSYDKKAVSDIIKTFLDNSMKHSRARSVSIGYEIKKIDDIRARVKIFVEDDGKGIKNGARKQVFTGLYQKNTNASMSIGMGMGLYHAKLISEKLDNSVIQCTDPLEFNLGIRFEIEFDCEYSMNCTEQSLSEIEKQEFLPFEFKDKHVVIADDVGLLRALLTRILENAGATVSSFENGKLAVDYIVNNINDIDVVLTDLYMPDYDGKYLIRNLKAMNYENPIVVITGQTFDKSDLFDKLYSMGADAILPKPLSLTVLTDTLTKLTNKKLDK